MSYFWFSFSKGGKNQGCINTQADTVLQAKEKVIDLGIVPKYDHVESFEVPEPELPLDVLVSREELLSMDYKSTKSIIKEG